MTQQNSSLTIGELNSNRWLFNVFSQTTSLLTITALTCHLLFGCCGHHSHDLSGCCDSIDVTQVTITPVVVVGSHKAKVGRCICRHQAKIQTIDVKQPVSSQTNPLGVTEYSHDSDSPCHHPSGCAHGRCVFMGSGAQLLLVHPVNTVQAYFALTSFVAEHAFLSHQSMVQTNRCFVHRISCDRLQSWQI